MFDAIREWLEECGTSHKNCVSLTNDGAAHPRSPTRLLDLSGGNVVLREDQISERYACLSHCWGTGGDILKTTTESQSKFHVQVPWEEIPKTFRDAIDICRRLDIQFLWIDSLCIIQDSDEDVGLTFNEFTFPDMNK